LPILREFPVHVDHLSGTPRRPLLIKENGMPFCRRLSGMESNRTGIYFFI
jgi:hypothetical protein